MNTRQRVLGSPRPVRVEMSFSGSVVASSRRRFVEPEAAHELGRRLVEVLAAPPGERAGTHRGLAREPLDGERLVQVFEHVCGEAAERLGSLLWRRSAR